MMTNAIIIITLVLCVASVIFYLVFTRHQKEIL